MVVAVFFLVFAIFVFLFLRCPHGRHKDLIFVHRARIGVVATVGVLPREVGDLF